MIVPDILRERARRAPGAPAVILDRGAGAGSPGEPDTLTLGEWDRRSDRIASLLVAVGLRPGDRVAIAFDNADADRFYVSYFGALKAGGIVVPIGVRLVESEVGVILDHARPCAALAAARHAETIARAGLDGLRLFGPEDYDRAVASAGAGPAVARRPEDPCDILYTSGTTGTPKGVVSSHASVAGIRGDLLAAFAGRAFVHAMPVYTFAGTHAMQFLPLRAGMPAVVMHRFDGAHYLALLAARRAAVSFAVPAMLRLALDAWDAMPADERPDLGALALLMFGSAPMPPTTLVRLPELFPRATLINIYALTEGGAAAAYCMFPPGEAMRRAGSVGRPVPPTELRVVVEEHDGPGRDARAGEVGEIWLRAKGPPRSYYCDPEATARTFLEGGWVRTGDLGHVDEDGYLYLDDRKKDMIIRGGFNVFTGEIDRLIESHPAVREAAVVGIPHPVLGEDLAAFVVLRERASGAPGPATEAMLEALRAHVAARAADYKVPRRWHFVDALPRNSMGKVVKRALAARAASEGAA